MCTCGLKFGRYPDCSTEILLYDDPRINFVERNQGKNHTRGNVMTESEIRAILTNHGVSIQKWGTGEAKGLDDLLTEIQNGESVLSVVDGKIRRTVCCVVVEVRHVQGGTWLVLIEEKQVFVDGRIRWRDVPPSIVEKIRPDETPEISARRALKEELGIDELAGRLPLQVLGRMTRGPCKSQSFPGLPSFYSSHLFLVYLPNYLYKKDGYIEEQDSKSTHFVWKNMMR